MNRLFAVMLVLSAACRSHDPSPVVTPAPPPVVSEPAPAVAAVVEEPAPAAETEDETLPEFNLKEAFEPTLYPTDVFFDPGSALIGPEQERALQANLELLRKSYVFDVFVEGHTDDTGSEQLNLALGDRRANTVKDYLIQHGVTAEIRIISYGETQPFDAKNRGRNRRAHIVVRRANLVAATDPNMTGLTRLEDPEFTVMRVFFATDRKIAKHTDGTQMPTTDPGGGLTFGWSTVSIPKDHRVGHWERPSKLEFRSEDQAKDVVLLTWDVHDESTFYSDLQPRVQRANDARIDLLVFVHGYRVSFEDALVRAAILAYDLKPIGPPVVYSWRSHGKLADYTADEDNNLATVEPLEKFLRSVAAKSGAQRIGIVAHSMGNRALIQALERIQRDGERRALPNIAEVVFTAPDVARDLFSQKLPSIARLAQRLTLYASAKDRALLASRKFHRSKTPRAGELLKSSRDIFLHRLIASIDVSAVTTDFLGHSYFGDNMSVISDIREMFLYGSGPERRLCLTRRNAQPVAYWVFDRCRP